VYQTEPRGGAADIATALGYSRTDQVSRIFLRHEREFSQSMTMIFRNTTLGFGVQPSDMRLFSLRGAHLVGMFARTTKGVEFRAWVLDQLDEIDRQAAPNRSLMAAWFEAKAAVDAQDKYASLCGKGLYEHQKLKPPLAAKLTDIDKKMQPSLQFN
jgi:prophage antirepressor-like protein